MPHRRPRPSTSSCIRFAQDLELQAAALYTALAVRFEGTPWLCEMLRGLAAEEQQHALRVKMLERIQVGVPWKPDALRKICGDVHRAIEEIREFQAVFTGPVPLEPARVIEAIIQVERTFVGLHAEMMSTSSSPAVSALFRSLSAQDDHHQALIAQAGARVEAERVAPPPPGGATRSFEAVHLG